jgi:two-component system sensor histidine kinase/response regulator
MNDHITKPIYPEQLFSKLLAWIQPGPRETPEDLPAAGGPDPAEMKRALSATIPGIDTSAGIARTGGNATLYVELLRKLRHDYADAASQIKAALESGETERARRLAHSVKGVCGNVGALEPEALASQLEASLAGPETMHEAMALLQRFEAVLAASLDAIGKALPAEARPEKDGFQRPIGDAARLLELLGDLAAYVAEREAKPCRDVVREIGAYAWPDPPAEQLAQLSHLVGRYQFKAAQELLTLLIEQTKGCS